MRLREAAAEGRLTLEEFAQRADRAYAAKTNDEGGSTEHGRDVPPRAGAPILRVRAFSLFGGTDLWRVPADAKGRRKELRRAAREAEREH
jgi:hypothetical protein